MSVLLLFGCSHNPQMSNETTGHEYVYADVEPIEAKGFTVYAPEGWVYTPQIGIDSAVGQLSGDGLSLGFIYGNNVGLFSQNSEYNASDYSVSQDNINGVVVTIYTPVVTGQGQMVLEIQNPPLADVNNIFGSENVVFNMFGEHLSAEQEKEALQIFRTIEFKG